MNDDTQPTCFTELFNNNPDSRLLNVFMEGREIDYPLTDLSRITGINRQRVSAKISFLLDKKLIKKTRISAMLPSGRAMSSMQLYQWNNKDPLAKALTEVFDQSIWKN